MRFPTQGLLSKWGFADGDMLDDFLWGNGYEDRLIADEADEDEMGFEHRVLCRVVEEHVVPKVKPHVNTYRILTIHNPIRAERVDGEEWGERAYNPDAAQGVLTPEYVDVPEDVILAIAREEV